jgi:hypothetical protein
MPIVVQHTRLDSAAPRSRCCRRSPTRKADLPWRRLVPRTRSSRTSCGKCDRELRVQGALES